MTDRPAESAPLTVPLTDVRDTLARNVSAARGALGISQDQLATAGGVSRATIIQLEAAEGDPRLSTLASVAMALGVSPIFLLIGRDELNAIAQIPGSSDMKRVQKHLSAGELETMRRLLGSGISKNRTKAVAMGTGAATVAGVATATLVGAAIGTALLPGVGTAIGAAMLSGWLAQKKASETNEP